MEQQIIDMLSGLETAVTTMAPQAWSSLVVAASVDGWLNLAGGLVGLAWLVFYTRFSVAKSIPSLMSAEMHDEFMIGVNVFYLITGGIACLVALVFVTDLLAARTWLGILAPESQVVRDLMNALK